MKLVILNNEDLVLDIVENIKNVERSDKKVQWNEGEATLKNYLILDNEINVQKGRYLEKEIKSYDKKPQYAKTNFQERA